MAVVRRVIFALVAMIVMFWDTPAAAFAASSDRIATEESKSSFYVGATYFVYAVTILAALVLASKLIMHRRRWQREEDRRKRLGRKAAQMMFWLNELNRAAEQYPRVLKNHDSARKLWMEAKESLESGQLDDAAEQLRKAQDYLDNGWCTYRIDSRDPHGAILVKRPDGSLVVITHASHIPQSQSSLSHPYFYEGGSIGGERWERGFYPDRFWTWTYIRTLLAVPNLTPANDR